MNAKRLDELKMAQGKLIALVDAVLLVRGDATAEALLEEVLKSTADGTGTHTWDLQHLVTVALAHAYAQIEVEQCDAAQVAA